jgi:hypothetical protein
MPTSFRFAALALGAAAAFILVMPEPSRSAAPDARITAVHASGSSGAYAFEVTISSNDTGCAHYVDWWEVLDENGALVYRRVLLHDHADEQPFSRDGGPVAVKPGQVVTVRAHVNTSGYATPAMRGSVLDGFKAIEVPASFAAGLAKKPPLPDVC